MDVLFIFLVISILLQQRFLYKHQVLLHHCLFLSLRFSSKLLLYLPHHPILYCLSVFIFLSVFFPTLSSNPLMYLPHYPVLYCLPAFSIFCCLIRLISFPQLLVHKLCAIPYFHLIDFMFSIPFIHLLLLSYWLVSFSLGFYLFWASCQESNNQHPTEEVNTSLQRKFNIAGRIIFSCSNKTVSLPSKAFTVVHLQCSF